MLNNNHFSIHCPTLYGVSFGTLRGVKQCSFYNILLHIVSSTLLRNHTQERINCKAVSIPDRLFLHRFGFPYIKIKNFYTAGKKSSTRWSTEHAHLPKGTSLKVRTSVSEADDPTELCLPGGDHESNSTGEGRQILLRNRECLLINVTLSFMMNSRISLL